MKQTITLCERDMMVKMEENNNFGVNNNVPYQQPGYIQPGYIPGQSSNYGNKKNKAGLIAGLIATAILIILIVICVLLVKTYLHNPQRQLSNGITNMTRELSEYTCNISELLGIDDINKLKDEKTSHTNLDMSFTIPNSEIENISLTVDALSDYNNQKEKWDVSVGTYGYEINVGDIVASGDTIYLSAPLFFDEDVYSIELENLANEFNSSVWSELLEIKLPEDFEITFFDNDTQDAKTDNTEDITELNDIFSKYGDTLNDAVEIESIKGKKDFIIDDSTVSCGGVRVTVDKDAYNDLIENIKNDILASEFYTKAIESYFDGDMTYEGGIEGLRNDADKAIEDIASIKLEQDFILDYYMDSKGRIVNISTFEDIQAATASEEYKIDSLSIDISFTGKERTLDEIDGGIYIKSGTDILYFGMERDASIDDEIYSENISILLQDDSHKNDIVFNYKNDWNYEEKSYDISMSVETSDTEGVLKAEGAFEDVVQGESYTLKVDNASLKLYGSDIVIISGALEIETCDDEIEVPDNSIKLLEMNETEIETMIYKAVSNMGMYE